MSYEEILKIINFNKEEICFNHIYNENCIDLIKKMIDEKIMVDAIITDPPYNISKKNNFKTIGRAGIDFGEWDKKFDQLEWLKNIDKILKNGGNLIIFNDWKNLGEIAKFLESRNFEIKDLIRWIKTNPMPRNTSRRYVTDFELALWAVKKQGKWTFNKDKTKPYLKPEYIGSPPSGNNRIHPTQKSASVISEIIKTHTNINDLIFDPFSGSGEISYSALKLHRKYIACEINEEYYKSSLVRFNKEKISPAFNHIGNKRRIIEKIIDNFDIENVNNFVDVFAGSGVVTANFKFAKKYFLNDNDPHIKQLLEYLFNNQKDIVIKEIKEIIKFYKLPIDKFYNYKEAYNKLKNNFNFKRNTHKFNNSAMLLVLVLYGFNQQIRFNSNNEFNIPMGKFYFSKYQENKIKKFISSVENTKVDIRNKDFDTFVSEIKNEIDVKTSLFYFDPPYLITNGTYNNSWTEVEEEKLLLTLDKLSKQNIRWVLSNQLFSNKKTNLQLLNFLEKNKNLRIFPIDISYKNSNYQRKTFDKDLEIIVRNF